MLGALCLGYTTSIGVELAKNTVQSTLFRNVNMNVCIVLGVCPLRPTLKNIGGTGNMKSKDFKSVLRDERRAGVDSPLPAII